MAKRFFKATDGEITVFRASDTRVYQSANIRCSSFSSAHASPIHGTVPAVEITKAEYAALVVLKMARVKGQRFTNSPSDSWVRNEEIV